MENVMKRLVFFFAGLMLAGLLAGCATLSKAECEAGDWSALGRSDGTHGYPLSYIDNHISACSEHGIFVNRPLYQSGREEGLRSYCRLDVAEREGRSGRTNYNSCQGQIGISFGRVYENAKDIYKIDQEIEVLNGQMDSYLARFTAESVTNDERTVIKFKMADLRAETALLNRRRALAERELRITYSEEQRRVGFQG